MTATVPLGWERGRRFPPSLSFHLTDPAARGPATANRSTGPGEAAVEEAELLLAPAP